MLDRSSSSLPSNDIVTPSGTQAHDHEVSRRQHTRGVLAQLRVHTRAQKRRTKNYVFAGVELRHTACSGDHEKQS